MSRTWKDHLPPLALPLLLPLLVLLAGCSERSEEPPGTDRIGPASLRMNLGLSIREEQGFATFRRYCAICHGDTGKGDGFNSFNLDPHPPDLVAVFKAGGPDQIRAVIESGTAAVGKSPQCPPWGATLSRDDIDAVVLAIGALERARSVIERQKGEAEGDTGQ